MRFFLYINCKPICEIHILNDYGSFSSLCLHEKASFTKAQQIKFSKQKLIAVAKTLQDKTHFEQVKLTLLFSHQSRGMPRQPSNQKNKSGAPPPRQINLSISKQDIELHKAKEAWKPGQLAEKKEVDPEADAATEVGIDGSANFQTFPIFVVFLCACDEVYHKQEVRFLLYLLGQSVT